jgi:hypothetical protein
LSGLNHRPLADSAIFTLAGTVTMLTTGFAATLVE